MVTDADGNEFSCTLGSSHGQKEFNAKKGLPTLIQLSPIGLKVESLADFINSLPNHSTSEKAKERG